ncbi:hypothetical protein CAPTEDRAFT_224751 [Capitella teleta]|uniref:Ig-like domain-containing protein n=1 Tax=Capitella teleta TaxID=283909 RepID=R7TEX3_CAPTE|nr:hypothetical protein CAPTEDRAFT_224751 [Capitella teleta]|eukprot:ELT92279.1 hypothetical protein CAPTEDRAFT_224751 [Capitella teleta]
MDIQKQTNRVQVVCAILALYYCASVLSQSMDPKVTITDTDPESDGVKVRGFIASDVWLNCYVENLPSDLQVRWQRSIVDKDGRPVVIDISTDMAVEDNMKWSIEKPTTYSWRLRIKALEIEDEGNYTCFVRLTSNNNRVEANRTVLSTDVPQILDSESSSDTSVKEGDMLPLRCNASGRPFPTIMWRREGNAILPGGGVRKMGSLLDISDIQYTARGRYLCEAFNEVGYDRRDIILEVQHSPKLFPDPASAKTGQAVGYQRTLICHVDANPAPSTSAESNQLYWSFDNIRISSDSRREFRIMQGAHGRLTYELIIYRVQSSDYGVFSCHARNTIGSTSVDIELFETDEPQPDKRDEISRATFSAVVQPLLVFLSIITCQLVKS